MSANGVEVFVASDGDRARWTGFVEAAPESEAAHRWEFHDALAQVFGAGLVRLVARGGDTWLGVLPLVVQRSFVGKFLTSVPYLNHAGVLGTDPVARRLLAEQGRSLAEAQGIDRLEIRGRDGSDLPIEVWGGKMGYTLELPPDPSAVWEALGAKVRAQVKRPAKEGYEARVLAGVQGRAQFYPLFARKWHELGSPVLPESFFVALESAFGNDIEYVVVSKSGAVAAAGVLLRHRARIEIPWACSATAHDRYGVNMMLYWRAIERAVERGATAFDFGRSSPDTGNARFKLQWGAAESVLRWNVLVRDHRGRGTERGDRRRGFVATAWRRLPRFVTARLGPALAGRIPY